MRDFVLPHTRSKSPRFSGAGRCVDALIVALNQERGGEKRWYTSSPELQLVSLELCRACRRVSRFNVWNVCGGTLRTLWSRHKPHRVATDDDNSDVRLRSRVPVVRVFCLTWNLSVEVWVKSAAIELLWAGPVEKISFSSAFNESIARFAWSSYVRTI